MFWFQRPAPKFRVGALVKCNHTGTGHIDARYILITSRRWIRPQYHTNKQWVYDGPVLAVKGDDIIRTTFTWCSLEGSLEYLFGPK